MHLTGQMQKLLQCFSIFLNQKSRECFQTFHQSQCCVFSTDSQHLPAWCNLVVRERHFGKCKKSRTQDAGREKERGSLCVGLQTVTFAPANINRQTTNNMLDRNTLFSSCLCVAVLTTYEKHMSVSVCNSHTKTDGQPGRWEYNVGRWAQEKNSYNKTKFDQRKQIHREQTHMMLCNLFLL